MFIFEEAVARVRQPLFFGWGMWEAPKLNPYRIFAVGRLPAWQNNVADMDNSTPGRQHIWGHILLLAGCTGAMLFSVFYLAHGHAYLAGWYLSLGDCFYRVAYWEEEVFTPAVKASANWYHLIALAISAWLALHAGRALRGGRAAVPSPAVPTARRGAWLGHGLLAVLGGLLCGYSHGAARPAYDEIFSAVNCAGIHPFQALSYYMLPNNHLLFNVLNGTLFAGMDDKVLSGRFISMLAFLAAQQAMFLLLKRRMPLGVAFVTVLLLSLSLPTLGFAAQARGYSLHLAAGWLCLLSLYHYVETGSRLAARGLVAGIVVGYATLPSFLYFHGALLGFAVCWQGYQRQFDTGFWQWQAMAMGGVFLFHLPALSFSGAAAFTSNRYVRMEDKPLEAFLAQLADLSHFFLDYGFSRLFTEGNPLVYVLYLAPLALMCSKHKAHRAIGLFYLLLWASVLVIVIGMKKIPFTRNLIIQYSAGLGILAYTLWLAVTVLAQRLRQAWLSHTIYMACVGALGLGFATQFPKLAGEQLYFNNANALYETNRHDMAQLPAGAQVGFCDEGFYWYYLFTQGGGQGRQCPQGHEAYLVKRASETLPPALAPLYEQLSAPSADGYEIWNKK